MTAIRPALQPDLARYREDYPILADTTYMNSNSMGAMPRQAAAARHMRHFIVQNQHPWQARRISRAAPAVVVQRGPPRARLAAEPVAMFGDKAQAVVAHALLGFVIAGAAPFQMLYQHLRRIFHPEAGLPYAQAEIGIFVIGRHKIAVKAIQHPP